MRGDVTDRKTTWILGVSAFYHDSAACLVRNGEIVAAAQEERFTSPEGRRIDFPKRRGVLFGAGRDRRGTARAVGFYDKPLLKFERLLETYLAIAPKGRRVVPAGRTALDQGEAYARPQLRDALGGYEAACSVRRAPRVARGQRVLPVALRGGGRPHDRWCGRMGHRQHRPWRGGTTCTIVKELHWPDSFGLLYSAFTYYTGFKVNSGEYKVMGLAPYGEPRTSTLIYRHLLNLKDDGSFILDQKLLRLPRRADDDQRGASASCSAAPPRVPESPLTQREMDLARSVQEVCEEIMRRMARHARTGDTGSAEPVPGGRRGAQLRRQRAAAARRAVQALDPARGRRRGRRARRRAARSGTASSRRRARTCRACTTGMRGSYLGPEYSEEIEERYLKSIKAPYTNCRAKEEKAPTVAKLLATGQVVGWFNGRDGVRPALARRRSHPRRPAQPEDAGTT
jgi:carbamoyltransferase